MKRKDRKNYKRALTGEFMRGDNGHNAGAYAGWLEEKYLDLVEEYSKVDKELRAVTFKSHDQIIMPNRVYMADFVTDTTMKVRHIIVIAGPSEEAVKAYWKQTKGYEIENLSWLMDLRAQTFWTQNGMNEKDPQVKVISYSNFKI